MFVKVIKEDGSVKEFCVKERSTVEKVLKLAGIAADDKILVNNVEATLSAMLGDGDVISFKKKDDQKYEIKVVGDVEYNDSKVDEEVIDIFVEAFEDTTIGKELIGDGYGVEDSEYEDDTVTLTYTK